MAEKFSNYQRNVIKEYYGNIDKIALTRLAELVTEIYLADSAEKKSKLWKRVETALKQLKISQAVADNILKQKDPKILAKNINDWLKSR